MRAAKPSLAYQILRALEQALSQWRGICVFQVIRGLSHEISGFARQIEVDQKVGFRLEPSLPQLGQRKLSDAEGRCVGEDEPP